MNIELPHNWRPRPYQMPLWRALQSGCKRASCVWHRRAGKDLSSMHWTARAAHERVGTYWHVLPTYRQGRKIIWDGRTKDGSAFRDAFPEQLIARQRDDEMTTWFKNGSVHQIVGADNWDSLVGTNPVGVIFSEWSLMDPRIWDYIRPILAENDGWAVFIFTPRGHNHGYKLHQMAEKNPDWFSQVLTVDDTGAITPEAIQAERDAGMPEEMIQQEFYCSFEAALVGSYFGDLLETASAEDRILRFPWEPAKPVITSWDLGMADSLSIWFWQQVAEWHRAIDFYHSSGVGLDHYAKMLAEKPYAYADHLVPHDAKVRELGTGVSRVETARDMGLRLRVIPKLGKADQINAGRQLLPKVMFEEKHCEYGLQALREYQKKPTDQRGPEGEIIYADAPLHNWASHPADAYLTYAVGQRPVERRREHQGPLAPPMAIV